MTARVQVVCTMHGETGFAKVSELQEILERIRPDVVFLELPSVGFDAYLSGTRQIPESVAASRYRAIHPAVALVPVDGPPPGDGDRPRFEQLFDRIDAANAKYVELNYLHGQRASEGGFHYLNSASSDALWSAIRQAERATVESLRDPGLVKLYAWWIDTHDHREREMMKNIVDYAKRRPFKAGVLLVGSAHKQGLVDKARLGRGEVPPTVEWCFEGALDGIV